MSAGVGQLVFNILCLAAFLASVVGVIRLRQRVSRLPGLPPTTYGGRRAAEYDAHPREIDDASGDDDGGDGGDA